MTKAALFVDGRFVYTPGASHAILDTAMIDAPLAYSRLHAQAQLAGLTDLLRIPSISTLPAHQPDMLAAANWLASHCRRIGLAGAELLSTAGPPVVFAQWLEAGPTAPTLLVYGHYDVQPVDPLDEWRTPPFEPTIDGDRLVARGASDDKGQVMAILGAVEAWLQSAGRLPVNLKIILEGEEEISSPSMAAFLRQQRDRLAADAVLICDQAMLGPGQPLIEYGVRGNCYLEIEVSGPATDLHSGTYGGAVDNPFNVLVRMLAHMQDGDTRRVLIPGFYDKVRPLSMAERQRLAHLPLTEDMARELTGAPETAGEAGYTLAERISVRPTFEIHGIGGGFTGPGRKTVIPARAAAKLSMRLVPDQAPEEIADLAETFIRAIAPPTVRVTVRRLGFSRPAVVDFDGPAFVAADRAYQAAFGVRPLYTRGGGSLPIVPEFQDVLKASVVMMGFGLPDDNIHAPNEWLSLANFHRGVETIIHYLALFAQTSQL